MMLFFEIISSFGKIGFTALGGGHSMLKLIEYEAVINRHWIAKDDFVTIIGSTFLFPGLTAVKLSAIIGYKVAGLFGLILAVLSLNLPGLIMAVFGYHFLSKSDSPYAKKAVISVQYGAIAMLAAAAYSLAEGVIKKDYSLPLAILSVVLFIGLAFIDISPFWGLIAFIGIAFAFLSITP